LRKKRGRIPCLRRRDRKVEWKRFIKSQKPNSWEEDPRIESSKRMYFSSIRKEGEGDVSEEGKGKGAEEGGEGVYSGTPASAKFPKKRKHNFAAARNRRG